MTTLVWFRQDLRLDDNPALNAALERGGSVVPVYIFDPTAEGAWPIGAAGRSWLHRSLAALDQSMRRKGSRLVIAAGDALRELSRIAHTVSADAVYWNRRYEPAARTQERRIAERLASAGLATAAHNGTLLFEPEVILNRQGGPFQVFTPFWRACLAQSVAAPRSLPRREWRAPTCWPSSLSLGDLGLRPTELKPARDATLSPWDTEFYATWTPGEAGARQRLRNFLRGAVVAYDRQRDFPAVSGTSMLSPHLRFGEISARQIWAAVQGVGRESGVFPSSNGAAIYLKELGWREFAYHQLWHFPRTTDRPLREAFAHFPWRKDPGDRLLRTWERGETGYPIVDAGMRQLWQTGWMHNRVRMIAASFLVKHLRLPWQTGARFFWDTLVDADLANNTLGWQWSAGSGADAAPYFRIFAPVAQGRKFDPDGAYVRTWVPELADVPATLIHAPWEQSAPQHVRLGPDYPSPIVDHLRARGEALAAFKQMRST